MPRIDQATVRNRLLAALPPEDFAELAPLLETVELILKQVLYAPGEPVGHVHFPESGVVSMITALEDGQAMEVGLVGREGLAGLPVLLGDGTAANQALVQAPGSAWRVEAAAFKAAFEASAGLRALLLRYALAFHDQVTQTAACNGRHGLEARLARWLLMAHDRAEGDAFPMTHEFLALMLGVRRAGVTVVLGVLRHNGTVAHERGVITVLDRPGLEGAACGCHRAVQRQFERLLGSAVG